MHVTFHSSSPPRGQPASVVDMLPDGAAHQHYGKTPREQLHGKKWPRLGPDPLGGSLKSGIAALSGPGKLPSCSMGLVVQNEEYFSSFAAPLSSCFLFTACSHSPLGQRLDPTASGILIVSTGPGMDAESEGNYGYVKAETGRGCPFKGEGMCKGRVRIGFARKLCCSHIPIFIVYLFRRAGVIFLIDPGPDLRLPLDLPVLL